MTNNLFSKKIPNPDHVRTFCQVITASPYPNLLSLNMKEITPGGSVCEIEIDNKHFQPYGVVHGGVFASLIDTATFWALYLNVEDETAALASIDVRVNYLTPVFSGKLIAIGRQIKLGKKLGYAEAEVRDESGQIIAHGTSTIIVLPGKGMSATKDMPPKFLTGKT